MRKFKLLHDLMATERCTTVEFSDGMQDRVTNELGFIGGPGAVGYAMWDGFVWCIIQMGLT